MHIAAIRVKPGAYMESQSGLQRGNPLIYCRYETPPTGAAATAFVLVHPTSNFHGHYLVEPLVARGAAVLAVNTRYIGNDSMLIMERAMQDLGAAIFFLRQQGHKRVVLIGNSGGGSLAAMYQQQAEKLTIQTTPDGLPFKLTAAELPPADTLVLLAAHPGRPAQLLAKIDPSVLDEADPSRIDPSLSMFPPHATPPYTADFLARYREAQEARLARIEAASLAQLATLSAGKPIEAADAPFLIHRTQADPRTLDLSIDANDRKIGTLGGDAAAYNEAANGLARFCTLRSFLSQWSPAHSRADGPACLAGTSVKVLIVEYTADQTVFPSHTAAWREAAGDRAAFMAVAGAPHYLENAALIDKVADRLLAWSADAT